MRMKNIGRIGHLISGMILLLALVACGEDDSDETPPILTLDKVSAPVVQESVFLSGTVEPGAVLQMKIDSEELPDVPIEVADGVWTLFIDSFPLGTHIVEFTALDEAENISILRFTLRRPAVLLGPLARVSPLSDQTLTGWKLPGLIVTVDGNEVSEGEVLPVDGMDWQKWSYDFTLQGSRTILFTAKDAVEVQETLRETVTLNSAAPLVQFDETLPLIATEESIALSGTVAEGAVLEVTLLRPTDEQPVPLENTSVTNGIWTADAILAPGSNRIVATAVAGGISGQALLDIIFPAE